MDAYGGPLDGSTEYILTSGLRFSTRISSPVLGGSIGSKISGDQGNTAVHTRHNATPPSCCAQRCVPSGDSRAQTALMALGCLVSEIDML